MGISVSTYDDLLIGVLSSVEVTIQNAIRSPVKLTEMNEWRAPVSDPRLILRWRPVNVEDATAGTADPVVLCCPTRYDTTGATTLTYGTDYVVSDLSSEDERFGLSGMLEATGGGTWWGFAGWGGNGAWGGTWSRPPTRLASTLTSDKGRLRVTYWAGWPNDAIPPVLADAAYLEAATIWSVRKMGRLLSSESLNGYSYQTAAIQNPLPGTSTKFASPIAASMLQQYIVPAIAGIGPW